MVLRPPRPLPTALAAAVLCLAAGSALCAPDWDHPDALAEAVERLEKVARTEGWESGATLDALHGLGTALVRCYRAAWAAWPLDASLRHRQERGDPTRLAASWYWQSRLAKLQENKSAAEEANRHALALAREHPLPPALHADILQQEGNLLRRRRRYVDAEPWYRRALELRRGAQRPDSLAVADNLVWLGHVLLRQRRPDAARPCFEEAETILRRVAAPEHPLWRPVLDWSYPELLRTDPAAAARALEHWRRACLSWRRQRAFRYGRPGGAIKPAAVRRLLEEGRPTAAWEHLENGLGHGVEECILLASAPGLHHALDADAALDVRPGPPPASDPDVWLGGLRAELDLRRGERAFLDALQGELAADPKRVRHALQPGEVLVGTAVLPASSREPRYGPGSLWAYRIGREGPVRWIRLLDEAEDPAAWRAWREDEGRAARRLLRAGGWPTRLPGDPDLDAELERLGAVVVAPLRAALEEATTLILVPGGLRVPWELLGDGRGGRLLDRWAVVHAPSATAFALLRERARRHRGSPPRPALVLGDPRFRPGQPVVAARSGSDPVGEATALSREVVQRSLAAGADPWNALPPLPASRAEAADIAALLPGATLLLGPEASETRLLADLRGRGIVHLATHALVDRRVPERSALALAQPADGGSGPRDGRLTAREISLAGDLDGALVTLSACQTAFGRGRRGFHLGWGFQRALFRAGAGNLVLSRWKVDDAATRMFMERFYRELIRPLPPAEALRAAATWLQGRADAQGRRPFAHPIYWAGFHLVGEGGLAP